jgi:acyl carrier protein
MRQEILDRVRELVTEAAPIATGEIHNSMSLTDELGYDSLSLLELINLLEAEFDLPEVPDAEIFAVKTIGDAAELVGRMLAERTARGARSGMAPDSGAEVGS